MNYVKYNRLLKQYYQAIDEDNKTKEENLKIKLYKKYGINKFCFRCNSQLIPSDLKQYQYLCLVCNENMYSFEAKENIEIFLNKFKNQE